MRNGWRGGKIAKTAEMFSNVAKQIVNVAARSNFRPNYSSGMTLTVRALLVLRWRAFELFYGFSCSTYLSRYYLRVFWAEFIFWSRCRPVSPKFLHQHVSPRSVSSPAWHRAAPPFGDTPLQCTMCYLYNIFSSQLNKLRRVWIICTVYMSYTLQCSVQLDAQKWDVTAMTLCQNDGWPNSHTLPRLKTRLTVLLLGNFLIPTFGGSSWMGKVRWACNN